MPPRKAPADNADAAEPPRRSSRIKDQPAPPVAAKKPGPKPRAKKPAAAAKKKDEVEEEDTPSPKGKKRVAPGDESDELSDEKPAAKKAKPSSKAAPVSKSAKPASAAPAAAVTKPTSKASRAGSKPASKAKADTTMHEAKEAVPAIAEEEEQEEEAAAAAETVKAMEIGDPLPSITLKNEKGDDVNVAEITATKGLVLFVIPKADTPGCTTQACAFRDSYEEFTKLDYTICCVSNDTSVAQSKWQTKKNIQYSFLSDPKRELIKAIGAVSGKSSKRSHFVFEKGTGKLLDRKLGVKADQSSKLALEFIQGL